MSTTAIVSLHDAHAYAGDLDVLHIEHLDIFPGDIISVMGPSGSGKTTLLRLLSKTLKQAGRRTSFIMQDTLACLNPLVRCDRQVRILAGQGGRSSAEALSSCGITPQVARNYPMSLSGGQRQRVAIAGALAAAPAVLLADEPTSALDPIATLEVLRALERLHEQTDTAIVIATHDQRVANKIATRHLYIEGGLVSERSCA